MSDGRSQITSLKKNAHIQYFLRCLGALPSQAQEHDTNRITIAYFCLSGLDLLGALEEKTTEKQRKDWADWIWSLQSPTGGFAGSTFLHTGSNKTLRAHLPSTYTALLCLAVLRAPLDRLNRSGLTSFLIACQGADGSFSPLPEMVPRADEGFQSDVRMTYCASVVQDLIGGAGIDRPGAVRFVERCKTWEGAYASRPGVIEAQGGTTYCSLASIALLSDQRVAALADRDETVRWICHRQIGGFQGRPGKLEDVCYSFWCGAALRILDQDLVDLEEDRTFLLSAQFPLGGFGKEPEDYPDPYHSYLALAALALGPDAQALNLKTLDPLWNISKETQTWLHRETNRLDWGT